MHKDTPAMAEELRQLLSQIDGVKKISETLSLHYVTVVDSEDKKENVAKVADALSEQAKQFGFTLEVIPVTQKELDELQNKLSTFQTSLGE
jgi:peptide subunit release factor 1 (eRF1)